MCRMTATDVPTPPPAAPDISMPDVVASSAPQAPAKAPVSVLAIISFALAVFTSVGYMTAKTLVPIFDGPSFERQVNAIAAVFGVLGIVSVVPIAISILLGHLGIHGGAGKRRGRALGIAGLSIGYLLLALYFNRIIVSVIAVISYPHGANFLENNFFWA
jgi:hypothetical protein